MPKNNESGAKSKIALPAPLVPPLPEIILRVNLDKEKNKLTFSDGAGNIEVPFNDKGQLTNETLKKILLEHQKKCESIDKSLIYVWFLCLDKTTPFKAENFEISPSSSKAQESTVKDSEKKQESLFKQLNVMLK